MPTVTISTTPSASFLAQRALYHPNPYTYVTLQPPTDEVAVDITDRVISCSAIDRATNFEPGQVSGIRIGDMTVKVSNDDGYFSPLNSSSIFYNKIYFNSAIKVYSGFYISSTVVEVMLQSSTLLETIKMDNLEGTATLYGMGKTKKALEKKIGEPDSDGNDNALSFMGTWKFSDIVTYILEEKADLTSSDYSVEDLPVYFTDIVFNDYKINDALSELAQAANCRMYETGGGVITITEFAPTFGNTTDALDLSDYIISITYDTQYQNLVNKVRVQYGENLYYNKDNTSTLIDAQYIVVNNRLLKDGAAAQDIGDKIIGKYGNRNSVATLLIETSWLPDKDVESVFLVTSSLLGLSSQYYSAYKIGQDLTHNQTTLYLEKSDSGDVNWGFLGSSADEGDGASPQASDYDSATTADKNFAYCSTTGSVVAPLYYAY